MTIPEAWQSQIVLCYEGEPYLAFDVIPTMLDEAIDLEGPPIDSDAAVQRWMIATLKQLREDVALIRDHSEELMLEPGRRDMVVRKAVMMAEYLLTAKQQGLANVGAVVFNLLARQSRAEPDAPAFEIMGLAKSLSVEDIRSMSTAEHLYVQQGDSVEEIPQPGQSKDRSKGRACVSIQAFWRNDQPGGLMLEMKANVAHGQYSLDTEMELLDQMVIEFAKANPSAAECNKYLGRMAQQRPEHDYATSFQIMATIAYAEEAGHLPSDEYNGMLYVYRVDEDGFFIDRKDRRTH